MTAVAIFTAGCSTGPQANASDSASASGTASRSAAPSATSTPSPTPTTEDDWRGSRHAQPRAYAWLNDHTPIDTYTILVVRGTSLTQVVELLGGVDRALPEQTPAQADQYFMDHLNPQTYTGPHIVQVARRGHAVVVYAPDNGISSKAVDDLSRQGLATSFYTDVNLDTYVDVSIHGRTVRSFDAGFRPPKRGALPQERGLPWGKRHQNIWATAWAYGERLTGTHLSEDWFNSPHQTFIAAGKALYF